MCHNLLLASAFRFRVSSFLFWSLKISDVIFCYFQKNTQSLKLNALQCHLQNLLKTTVCTQGLSNNSFRILGSSKS